MQTIFAIIELVFCPVLSAQQDNTPCEKRSYRRSCFSVAAAATYKKQKRRYAQRTNEPDRPPSREEWRPSRADTLVHLPTDTQWLLFFFLFFISLSLHLNGMGFV